MFQIYLINDKNIAVNTSCIASNCVGPDATCCDCNLLKIDAVGKDSI